jgi:hypothetical protein
MHCARSMYARSDGDPHFPQQRPFVVYFGVALINVFSYLVLALAGFSRLVRLQMLLGAFDHSAPPYQ